MVEEELTLYDPLGSWRFFADRLDKIVASAEKALEICPIEEVEKNRAKLKLARHLVQIPTELRRERARLLEMLDG